MSVLEHLPTTEELSQMTLEDAENRLSNIIYEASKMVEQLENLGKVQGNGHHIRGYIAKYAQEQLRKYWQNRTEAGEG
jgi:hypothetical protein